ncbi:carboxymuconolactone decarboxylase family protein [Rhizobium sp. GR12]|uniref:carboxymuconolactone decarboxylase family protein n=1 Tax=Rhizobium sp. GR12 TaxID=3053925 RepID=UPI002FBE795F
MTQRICHAKESPDITKKFVEFVASTKENAVEEYIRDLVNIRVAQLNNCTFCLDMHIKQTKIHGERDLRLFHLSPWRRDSTLFAPRDALCWHGLNRGRTPLCDRSQDGTRGTHWRMVQEPNDRCLSRGRKRFA